MFVCREEEGQAAAGREQGREVHMAEAIIASLKGFQTEVRDVLLPLALNEGDKAAAPKDAQERAALEARIRNAATRVVATSAKCALGDPKAQPGEKSLLLLTVALLVALPSHSHCGLQRTTRSS